MALGPIQQVVDYRDAGMPLQPLLAKGETRQGMGQPDLLPIQRAVVREYESQ
jgi:hypothetical protein